MKLGGPHEYYLTQEVNLPIWQRIIWETSKTGDNTNWERHYKYFRNFARIETCIFIEALCYPVICRTLKNQEITFARSKFGNFSKLELADFNENSSELPIGILVGVDYYHQLLTGKVIKNEPGPIASSSISGWVLSGRFPCVEGSSSCLSTETHSIHCFLEQKPDQNNQKKNLRHQKN